MVQTIRIQKRQSLHCMREQKRENGDSAYSIVEKKGWSSCVGLEKEGRHILLIHSMYFLLVRGVPKEDHIKKIFSAALAWSFPLYH